jgi:SM-20-related protein
LDLAMALLNFDALEAAPLEREPYEHVLVSNVVPREHMAAVIEAYPHIDKPGSFPLSTLTYGEAFDRLIAELDSERFRKLAEDKFGVDLEGKPTMFTARGQCKAEDGQIHTDSKTKILTILLYLNDDWMTEGGRLRLLNNGQDLDAAAKEIAPDFGTMLIFKRSENSWHGHLPYEGPRRVVQMNWVTSKRVAAWEQFRHKVSAAVKRAAA